MNVRDNRLHVLQQIDTLLNGKCGNCKMREELNRVNGRTYSRSDGYCNRDCPVGQQLQGLGKQLVRS